MSLKYQRVKQADLNLPAPLRWLTRAFSSITLAVCLLTCVVLYGVVASVPIAYLAKGGLYAIAVLGGVGAGIVWAYQIIQRGPKRLSAMGRTLLAVGLITAGLAISVWGWLMTDHWTQQSQWFTLHRATVIYRLPYFEMTELEFYSWWPLRVILILFLFNMVWATIRRIEFKIANIGVLTVHTGIVLMAGGSIFYGSYKIEGDTILWRRDLGGEPVAHFYDLTTPAIYFLDARAQPLLMLSLADLPRYNDYDPDKGELNIRLHESPAFRAVFGDHLRATIRGFIGYGEMEPTWIEAPQSDHHPNAVTAQTNPVNPGANPGANPGVNPALRLGFGDEREPREGFDAVLIANTPDARVIDQPTWTIEYLVAPGAQRITDLTSEFTGEHGLVVEIPADTSLGQTAFRAVYSIEQGQSITIGDTGYTITVEAIGDYGMSFVSEGYKRAQDTRAMVRIEKADRSFRRIAFHRYPERNQDFVPAPDDPTVGPMGRRTDPDPAIRLAYIDASKLQYRLISLFSPPAATDSKLKLLARVPGRPPVLVEFTQNKLPVIGLDRRQWWIHITERLTHAVQTQVPVVTPKKNRQPKDEGTYLHALLPVDLETDGETYGDHHHAWRQRVWLTHMRYPRYPDIDHRPITVELPANLPGSTVTDPIMIAFSRFRQPLPFSITLDNFEMQTYPGTQIPRDYIADLGITPVGPNGQVAGQPTQGLARLNNPLIHEGIKISQTGWDPGDRNDPNHQAKDEQGRLINQQRYTILGIGNNVGIRVIFAGACLVVMGIPLAFYVKPLIVQRQKRRLQQQAQAQKTDAQPATAA